MTARDETALTAEWYRRAARTLAPHSGLHAQWSAAIADDPAVLELVVRLPRGHRQPSLVLCAAAYAGAPTDAGWDGVRGWLLEHWHAVECVAASRSTQTNEPGRTLPLAMALARIAGPIALVELGASAGLCLLPDRYLLRYRRGDGTVEDGTVEDGTVEDGTVEDGTVEDDTVEDGTVEDDTVEIGTGSPVLETTVDGEPVPLAGVLPEIVWRRGIDLAPLSVRDPDDVRWLEALVPPDRPDRLLRLRSAIATAAADPPQIRPGDALGELGAVLAEAPDGVTVVVACLGTAVYLVPDDRARLLPAIARGGARAITFEGEEVLPQVAARRGTGGAGPGGVGTPTVLALDGQPIARCSPHGDRMTMLEPS